MQALCAPVRMHLQPLDVDKACVQFVLPVFKTNSSFSTHMQFCVKSHSFILYFSPLHFLHFK